MRTHLGVVVALWAILAPAARGWPDTDSALVARRAAALEEHFLEHGPSLALSRFYRELPLAYRVELAGTLRDLVAGRVPPQLATDPRVDELPPLSRRFAREVIFVSGNASPEEIERRIASQDLDHFAPMPVRVLSLYQDALLAQPAVAGGAARSSQLAGDRKDRGAWAAALAGTSGYLLEDRGAPELELLSETDAVPAAEVPHDTDQPALGGHALVSTRVVHYPDHVLANSARLARAVNLLMRPPAAGPLTLKIAGTATPVDSPEALIAAIQASGRYDIGVYDARMFVNFLDYSVKQGDDLVGVRIPTWCVADVALVPGQPLLAPVFHSEYVLALHKKGAVEPEALARWYLAVPDRGEQGTYFAPAHFKRRSWSGYRIVRGWSGPEPAGRLLAVARRLMRAFNFLQARYRFPMGAYGNLGVCNDTTGILELALRPGERPTAWPLVRDPRFDMYLAPELAALGVGAHVAGAISVLAVPADTRPDLYPEVRDRACLLHRIGVNLPYHTLEELHFPDLAASLATLAPGSPELADGLGMRAR